MSFRKGNTKGLQDIRTLSGSVNRVFEPHRAYLRISCLEMEKLRKGNEKKSAMHRVNIIDARFKEIQAEKDALLLVLDQSNRNNHSEIDGHVKTEPDQGCNMEGFKITY